MTLMQIRMSPDDVIVHQLALGHVHVFTSNADVIAKAAELSAHLEYRAVRLWGADWRRHPDNAEADGFNPDQGKTQGGDGG